MKRKLFYFSALLISFLSFSAFITDDDPFAALLKKLQDYTKNYPTEKVHIHLDKPYYAVGDDIWFKAYVTDSRTSAPTNISNILYVELINGSDSLKKRLKLEMKGGITWGDFKLTDSLSEGNYRIRAYTQLMRNAGPNFFFDKTIKIGNSWANSVFTSTSQKAVKEGAGERVNTSIIFSDENGKPFINKEVNFDILLNERSISKGKVMTSSTGEAKISILNTQPNVYKSGRIIATITISEDQKSTKNIPIKSTSSITDVQFFPEGGQLIEGLPSKVAFKATNPDGRGENVSGKIIDNEGTEILDFESTYLGMGSFALSPMAGKTYTAKVKFKDGTTGSVNLPKPLASGYIISLNNLDSTKIGAKVLLSQDLINKGELNLIGQHNGNVVFAAKIPTARQIASVAIPKTTLPSGIIVFTLFTPQNEPVAERIAFVNNSFDKINVVSQNLKQSYAKRGNVSFDILSTIVDKPTQGSFSVAVSNAAVVTPDPENESNILTSLLLTADLTGYVEKPNHYFLNDNINTRIELDHLMLTQGWRKIDWAKIKNDQMPAGIFEAEKGLRISGIVMNGGKPAAKAKVSLLSSSGGLFATDTLTDANGKFAFDQISFNQGTKFSIKAALGNDSKNLKILMDQSPDQLVSMNKNMADIEINVNDAIKPYLKQSKEYLNEQEKRGFIERIKVLKQVEIIGEKPNKAPNSSNLNGGGNADAVFTDEDIKASPTLTHFLNGRVAGLFVKDGLPSNTRNGKNMTVYVDGVMTINGMDETVNGSLDDLTIMDIESIEVLKSIAYTTMYGHAGSNGVIVITTKTGKSRAEVNTNAPGMITYTPRGYYAIRKFYSPQYNATPDPKPDLRTTVYWNPHLVTDTNGKANISFFNPDQPGNYRMVIEGIDAMGNLARKVLTYEVK